MAGKVKTNEVILQSPNGLQEATLSLSDSGVVSSNKTVTLASPSIATPNITGGLNLDGKGMLLKEFSGSVSVATITWVNLFSLPIGLTLVQTTLGGFYDDNYSSMALISRRSLQDSGTIISKSIGSTYKTDIQLSSGFVQGYQSSGGTNIFSYRYLVIG